jgi:hypothetical protein
MSYIVSTSIKRVIWPMAWTRLIIFTCTIKARRNRKVTILSRHQSLGYRIIHTLRSRMHISHIHPKKKANSHRYHKASYRAAPPESLPIIPIMFQSSTHYRPTNPLPIANHAIAPLRTSNKPATTNMATTFSTECLTSSVREITSPDSSSISMTTERCEARSSLGMYCISVSRYACVWRTAAE